MLLTEENFEAFQKFSRPYINKHKLCLLSVVEFLNGSRDEFVFHEDNNLVSEHAEKDQAEAQALLRIREQEELKNSKAKAIIFYSNFSPRLPTVKKLLKILKSRGDQKPRVDLHCSALLQYSKEAVGQGLLNLLKNGVQLVIFKEEDWKMLAEQAGVTNFQYGGHIKKWDEVWVGRLKMLETVNILEDAKSNRDNEKDIGTRFKALTVDAIPILQDDESIPRGPEWVQRRKRAARQLDLKYYYDMSFTSRGKALIFNHHKYNKEKLPTLVERVGTNKDRDELKHKLEMLNFEVIVHEDQTKKQIDKTLKAVAEESHKHSDCLVVVVLTHGEKSILYAQDEAYSIEDLWTPFTPQKCRSLIGKPKLFFIQACRGSEEDLGAIIADAPAAVDKIPTHADFMFAYATAEGYIAWRDEEEGSWFIQSLCDELEDPYKNDLLTMLTFVCQRVAYGYSTLEDDVSKRKKQVPAIVSQLTKLLQFCPK